MNRNEQEAADPIRGTKSKGFRSRGKGRWRKVREGKWGLKKEEEEEFQREKEEYLGGKENMKLKKEKKIKKAKK